MCSILSNEGGFTMQVWQAALIGLLCYLGALTTPWALGTTGGWYVLTRPLVAGFLCGLILGDVKTGVLIGIAVQGVFIALITPGGSVPADLSFASYLGIPLALVLYLPGPARWSAAGSRYCNPVTPDRPFSSSAGLVPARVDSRGVPEGSNRGCCSDWRTCSTHLLLVLLSHGDRNNSTPESGGVTCLTSPYNSPMIKATRAQLPLRQRKHSQGVISTGPGGSGRFSIFQRSVWNVCRHLPSST